MFGCSHWDGGYGTVHGLFSGWISREGLCAASSRRLDDTGESERRAVAVEM